jgi:hypothetical protein
MKASILSFGLCFGLASANIKFNHVPLSCDRSKPGYTGCLRGQHCTDNGLCVPRPIGALALSLTFRYLGANRRMMLSCTHSISLNVHFLQTANVVQVMETSSVTPIVKSMLYVHPPKFSAILLLTEASV